jgi:hypothetical protein
MNVTFTAEVIEAEDGSGDAILQFPEEFVSHNDWREGDRIHMEVVGESLVMKNLDWMARENISIETETPLDKPLHDS